MALRAPRDAASRSASARTMLGDFPPSSSDTFFKVPAARAISPRPTSDDPVNAIASMPGWSTMAFPTTLPPPGMTFSTPGGRPHSRAYSANFNRESDVFDAGFEMMVLPQARAGAIFQTASMSGKFHGVIAPTTPSGSRSVYVNALSVIGMVSPVTLPDQPAK